MKFKDFIEQGNILLLEYPELGDWTVVVPVQSNQIGGRGFVKVSSLHPGFDWDWHKIFVEPEMKLVKAT